ncbi:alpha/beta fold hydrolase [Butyricicoccus pullicaecorum]|uniref:EF-hand domain-containing protein n=1 Tax=Butyricicoccus pullicaecorum 1.2 TaxID=1203606 RepID=R8VX79_9FIRM|nr:alpha/beta fold hydrolase [Butyricicoccus pullicaecorum]EOQ37340.1 hypothetical protein HMPREF1526_02032 [Butyricicoccus pullicaecorum 1.2]SKA59071.1 hypothetical protein SAMN02745978_01557 [Butyricicoccus pullicaecorum DSM 23266]
MFAALSLLAAGLLALSPSAYLPPVTQAAPAATGTVEALTIPSFDAYPLQGRLYLPSDQSPRALVIYVNGSGPNTNQNTRQLSADATFSYFDLVASGFNEVGAAFLSYSTRGVTASDTPPFYHTIDPQAYQTYLPEHSVQDVAAIVRTLRTDSRLHDCPIYLLGWSEGTMIAPKVAQLVPVDGLLLAGYVNGTMQQVLDWQQTGGSSMVTYCLYFDADGDGRVSQAEYENDRYGVRPALGLEQVAFPELDADGDGQLTASDFAALLAPSRQALYDAIARSDDAWLTENYPVRLTSAWFQAHAHFTPNRDMLTELDLPIVIFQGQADANVPVQDTLDIQAQFVALGKDNLTVHLYPNADHDLNFASYLSTGVWPQAWCDLFAAVAPK